MQIERIVGSAFDDVLSALNAGSVVAWLEGGAGNDQLFGNGYLGGGAGNDRLTAGDVGGSILFGGDGNDVLVGGLRQEYFVGGGGADTFVFNALWAGSPDVIVDFNANATDRILLDPTIFAAIGSTLDSSEFRVNAAGTARDANDFILWSSATGALYYDADGSGPGGKQQFATLVGLAGMLDFTDFTTVPLPLL